MRRTPITARLLAALAGGAILALGLSACQIKDDGDDLVAGKTAFVAKCGSCHTLERAGTTGVTGPDLDAAFRRSLGEGFKRSTVEGIVRRQIEQPAKTAQIDPLTGKQAGFMPANLVDGELAEDVAAYVAFATARKGGSEDPGRLADIGAKKATEIAEASNGALAIPADPGGALAFTVAGATATAGALTINSVNKSSVPHNIALEGDGVDEKGPVVQGGATSTIKVDVQAGEYTFYCSVPGHREGGMEGKLTVEE
jgi:plastocyanin